MVGSTHTCNVCGKTFNRRALRDNHLRTHTTDRPFSCSREGCKQTFKQKHEQSRYERTAQREKTFVCGGVIESGDLWGYEKALAKSDGLLEHHGRTNRGRRCLEQYDTD